MTPDTQTGKTLGQFSERLRAFIAANAVERLVIDMRHNGGGNYATYAPFLEMIRANQFINRPGKLFTIIGRGTFSDASNFTDIERATSTLLVGEATGGSPNQ